MKADIIKVGLVGVGSMGQNHLRNLAMLKMVKVEFIYDLDRGVCQQLSSEFGVRVSENIETDIMIVDAVVIVTPTSTHFDYVKLASRFVKYIFVEKPLTDSFLTTKELAILVRNMGVGLQIGFIERYNPAVVALKGVIKNCSKVINIDFIRTNKVSSRITDVGVVLDLMIHDIDLAIYLNGPVVNVQANGYMKDGMIEYARANITHNNGAFSNVVASRITEKRIRQISATCDNMYIDCNLLSKEVFVNKQTIEQYFDNVSISSKKETVDVRPQEGLLLELLDFIKFAQGEKLNVANEEDALAAIKVAESIRSIIMREKSCVAV